MTSLYEVLKRSKTAPQLAPDMFTALWAKSITAGKTIELSGQVPLSFKANGEPLIDYTISGNMEQSGTPTQDNPITPSECGDLEAAGEHAGQFKITISSAGQTNNIYLGEVQTTRIIKKLVLTGEELWTKSENGIYSYFSVSIEGPSTVTKALVCSHFVSAAVTKKYSAVGCMLTFPPSPTLRIRTDDIENVTLNDFTAYLTQQYANGTPVTVWYVLETPETGIVNEPIRKIGDYADTLSMEQAGVQIPTNNGSTTFDVLTAVKPSNVSIKYRV